MFVKLSFLYKNRSCLYYKNSIIVIYDCLSGQTIVYYTDRAPETPFTEGLVINNILRKQP